MFQAFSLDRLNGSTLQLRQGENEIRWAEKTGAEVEVGVGEVALLP